ncbi:hypothetical protein Cni_G01713 [Canna indica]|uniref:Pre-PUA domain-containing protein n=1 Tax=Canna indica TaxID=4628 RepID=A0AAQ3JNB4_9LILI|nr:hypothetical protein Cni_G01713 [Canna indica]
MGSPTLADISRDSLARRICSRDSLARRCSHLSLDTRRCSLVRQCLLRSHPLAFNSPRKKKGINFQLLKAGADKKKLRRTAKERFPQASDADIDEILPTKAEITVAKYTNRVHVYSIEGGIPMLFDIDGRGTEKICRKYSLRDNFHEDG